MNFSNEFLYVMVGVLLNYLCGASVALGWGIYQLGHKLAAYKIWIGIIGVLAFYDVSVGLKLCFLGHLFLAGIIWKMYDSKKTRDKVKELAKELMRAQKF